jgi:hypothetical protein
MIYHYLLPRVIQPQIAETILSMVNGRPISNGFFKPVSAIKSEDKHKAKSNHKAKSRSHQLISYFSKKLTRERKEDEPLKEDKKTQSKR